MGGPARRPGTAPTVATQRRPWARPDSAVVSDAWPELPHLHDGVGLGGYFEAYAISAVLGCTKPDPQVYQHASDALGLAPERCLFVDDDPELVRAAIAVGYQGCVALATASPLPARGQSSISVGSSRWSDDSHRRPQCSD